MSEESSLDLIKRIKALAEAGLIYHQNEYDNERYQELREISHELLSKIAKIPISAMDQFYMPPVDYPTPKVDIRGFCLNSNNEVLMVKEKLDGKWSIPGGWGEIGLSPSEVIIKEIKEETGLNAKVKSLLAVYDKKCHQHPPQPFYVYKMVFLCETLPGEINTSFDIEQAKYFSIDNLPPLSKDRILQSQINQLFRMANGSSATTYFD